MFYQFLSNIRYIQTRIQMLKPKVNESLWKLPNQGLHDCKNEDKASTVRRSLLTLKNVISCLKTNIYSYLKTSGGQSYNQYLNVVYFFNTGLN